MGLGSFEVGLGLVQGDFCSRCGVDFWVGLKFNVCSKLGPG